MRNRNVSEEVILSFFLAGFFGTCVVMALVAYALFGNSPSQFSAVSVLAVTMVVGSIGAVVVAVLAWFWFRRKQ